MHHSIYSPANLTTFTNLDRIGLTAIKQRLTPSQAEILCEVTNPDPWCRPYCDAGVPRETVTRRHAHEPSAWHPTSMVINYRRYRCANCRRMWREVLTHAAAPRQKISRTALHWTLTGLICQHLTVSPELPKD